MKQLNVFIRFVLVLLAGIGLLVGLLSFEFSRVLRREMLELVGWVIAAHVKAVAEGELPTELDFAAATQDAGRTRFRALERQLFRMPETMRVKVWDAESRVVYSDEPRLIGLKFPGNVELGGALNGDVKVQIGVLKEEHFYESESAPEHRLLEVYVPIAYSSARHPSGVVEVYIYSPTFFAHLDDARRKLWLLSSAVGVGIFLALGGIFMGAWRKELDLTRQLEEARRFSEDIVEHVDTGIMVLDRNFLVLSWNKAMERLYGTSLERDRILGTSFFDLFPHLRDGELHGRLIEVARTGAAWALYAQPCPIGVAKRLTVVNLKLVPIEDETRRVSKVLVTIEDITEVQKLEAQVIQADKLATIGEMYASLTHEINNPLGIIVSKVKTLQEEGLQAGYPAALLKDFEQIERQSARIADIIRSLLTFARKASFEKKPLDINHLILDTVALVSKPFAAAGVRLVPELQPDLPEVRGDPNLLQQVLMNLLSNAKDAMPQGGRVRIISRLAPEENGAVVFEVEDEGTGIQPGIIDKIFHPFFTTKEVGKGTGLGLSVSYGIVQSQGGDMRVSSREGAGAVFTVMLPADDQT